MSGSKTATRSEATQTYTDAEIKDLQKQWGGAHRTGFLNKLPESWIPFIQLARLSPPVPLFLIYFPHLYGVIFGAIVQKSPVSDLLYKLLYLLGGSLFFSNAAHGWDDLVDAPIDRLIARTQKRPIVRGAITPTAAFIFTAANALLTASFLIGLPRLTSYYVLPTMIGTTYYPFAKRHINCPQVILGFCLAWGISVGVVSMGADPMVDNAVSFLVVASACWAIIFDTIYASMDLKDDIRFGLGSTAVLFGKHIRFWLTIIIGVMLTSLWYVGLISGFGLFYYVLALGGSGVALVSMIMNVKFSNGPSCGWWFNYGFWGVGASIVGGLLSEYISIFL